MNTGTNTFDLKRENLLPLDLERLQTLGLSKAARTQLQKEVEAALQQEPVSVVRPKRLAPSGDPHDYVSLAAYFWPNPDTEDGLPWISRDGEINPERDEGDCIPLFQMCTVVRLLCLGHVLLKDPNCLPRAEDWIRTWFLDPETRMHPHMCYAQYVPGRADGHCWGLIDGTLLPGMLDAVLLIQDELDPGTLSALREWVATFARWFIDSDLGREEAEMHNNHASWHLAQAVGYLSFAHQEEEARKRLQHLADDMVLDQIEADGSQPHELDRTLSYMYSCYNLLAHTCTLIYAERLGVELQPESMDRLKAASNFLEPAAAGEPWDWPQIKPLDPTLLLSAMAWLGRISGQPDFIDRATTLASRGEWAESYRRELVGI